jgi:glycosyltransferase involved in cell wall biosynthesis
MDSAFRPGLVSVIVPTYNRATLLAQALDSVRSQTYRPVEAIVVDDGSTDSTQKLLGNWIDRHAEPGKLELRSFRQRKTGAPAARNRGLIESRGEYVQFLDSDDLLHPRKLERQVQVLREDRACDFVYSPMARFTDIPDYGGKPTSGQCHLRLLPDLIGGMLWQNGSGLYRRSACVKIGPWNESLLRLQDWEYAVRFVCMKQRYYRMAMDAMAIRDGPLVREALADASRKNICPLCRTKACLTRVSHTLLGAGIASLLLRAAGGVRRGLAGALVRPRAPVRWFRPGRRPGKEVKPT